MFDKYLAVGGQEIANAERVQSYVENVFPEFPLKRFDDDTVSVHDAVNNFTDYTSPDDPFGIPAPWYVADEPATLDFLGVYPLSITGIGDSTMAATVTESILDGGSVGAARDATRSVKLSALLVGKNELGVEAGLAWLRGAVRAQSCSTHGALCPSVDMSFFLERPEATPTEIVGYNIAADPKPNQLDYSGGPATGTPAVTLTAPANATSIYPTLVNASGLTPSGQAIRYTFAGAPTGVWSAQVPMGSVGSLDYLTLYVRPSFDMSAHLEVHYVDVDTKEDYGTVVGPGTDFTHGRFGLIEIQAQRPSSQGRIHTTITIVIDSGGTNPQGNHVTRRNLVTNPALSSTSGWSRIGTTNPLSVRESRIAAYRGSGQGHAIYGGSPSGGGIYQYSVGGLVVGQTYTWSAYVAMSKKGGTTLVGTNGIGTFVIGGKDAQVDPAGGSTFQRYYKTFQARSSTATLQVQTHSGTTVAVAAMMLEQDQDINAYFDGFSPSSTEVGTYGWVGAANSSQSTLTVVGDTIDFSSIMMGIGTASSTATIEPYFDGDFPDDSMYTYSWQGIPNASASVRFTNSLAHQLEPFQRVYHEVAATAGPTIIKRMQFGPKGCNGSAIQVEILFTAGNPRAYGPAEGVTLGSPGATTGYRDSTAELSNLMANGANNANAAPWMNGVNANGSTTNYGVQNTTMPSPAIDSSITSSPYVAVANLGTSAIAANQAIMSRNALRGKQAAGVPYSYAVWVLSTVAAVLNLAVSQGTVTGTGSRPTVAGPPVNVPANTWTRMTYDPGSTAPTYTGTNSVLSIVTTNPLSVGSAGQKIYATAAMVIPQSGIDNVPYFDGDTPFSDTNGYYWQGGYPPSGSNISVRTTSLDAAVPYLLQDPTLPGVPASPAAPVITDAAITKVVAWDRRVYPIPASLIAEWAQSIPTITLANNVSNVARNIRIRFFPDPGGTGTVVDPNGYVGDFLVSYLPANGTMQINGMAEDATAEIGASGLANAGQLLYGSNGGVPLWPKLDGNIPYVMSVDVPTGGPVPTSISLALNREE